MSSTTLTSHRFRSFLADDSLSLRSFRRTQSPTPSLKASSLKTSTPFAKILNSSRKGPAHATTYQPTLKDLSRPSFDEKDLTLAIGLPLL
ncbi:hypothetical protein CPB83DRAFT_466955 [Crepidotus variabilis]|uniref:Uncharacterized protein n=1 Tax=Crepidotus variabilis TaxID=179855 RepID=A0A9P6JN90_9AGAR|nr:hypothetical protein CPB83DRAFT_466955 [Crepidotus variabilis]